MSLGREGGDIDHTSAYHDRCKSPLGYFCITLYPATPGGGGWRDGAAAGVFQIITSGCGGGGSPWQPQCLQHPTTEGNRATERRNPVLLLRTSESGCAREWKRSGNGFRGHRRTARSHPVADGIE